MTPEADPLATRWQVPGERCALLRGARGYWVGGEEVVIRLVGAGLDQAVFVCVDDGLYAVS
jgi:hypothetical protein